MDRKTVAFGIGLGVGGCAAPAVDVREQPVEERVVHRDLVGFVDGERCLDTDTVYLTMDGKYDGSHRGQIVAALTANGYAVEDRRNSADVVAVRVGFDHIREDSPRSMSVVDVVGDSRRTVVAGTIDIDGKPGELQAYFEENVPLSCVYLKKVRASRDTIQK